MQVHHVVLAGDQAEIGRELARIASERHGTAPAPTNDPRRTRARRTYFERNYPAHLERMRGAAEHFGTDLENDDVVLSSLSFGFSRPGCTVVFYPPDTTALGRGVLSRNFDFTTGTMDGRRPGEDDVAVVSSPYVLELYPDEGYASLSICAYDLLGGVVDGINSEGLTVALLADDEMMARGDVYPHRGAQVGYGVLQVGRFLLETCANVEEAKQALLEAKLYYTSIPCHYIVADRHGESFVWENSPAMSVGYVIEGDGGPQVTTNYMQHLHPDPEDLPAESHRLGSFNRTRTLRERMAAHDGRFDLEFIRANNACVSATDPPPAPPRAPGRTLWHALYFPEERRMEVDFYLGESAGDGGETSIRRSGYLSFGLREGGGAVETGRAAPDHREAREGVVEFESGELTLVADLFLPAGQGPHPAVIMTHGAEKASRKSFGYRRFAELFTRTGLAVLLFDKRGVGDSEGVYVEAPDLDVPASDVLAAFRYLRSRDEVDAERIGVFGVSQGGWVGPLAASKSDGLAFVIAVSGPGVSPLEQNLFDKGNQLRARGLPDQVVDAVTEMRRLHWTYLTHGTGLEEARAMWETIREEPWFSEIEWPIPMGDRESLLAHPRLRSFAAHNAYEPRPVLERLDVPFLAVFGEADTIVPVEASVEVMRSALEKAGNTDATLRVFPEADHGIRVRTPDGGFALAPGYMELLEGWLRERLVRDR